MYITTKTFDYQYLSVIRKSMSLKIGPQVSIKTLILSVILLLTKILYKLCSLTSLFFLSHFISTILSTLSHFTSTQVFLHITKIKPHEKEAVDYTINN